MPTSGVDYPSKRGTDIMVGVPATNNTTWNATAEQITFRQGVTWYALFFNRSFISYNDSTKMYSYVDSDWYGVEIGTVGENGATNSSPPRGARNTSYGPRYDNLIKQGASRVKLTLSNSLPALGLTRPGTVPPLRQSPVDLGWSPSQGAAARKDGWDPRAIVPSTSREPGQTPTVNGGTTTPSATTATENEPTKITVFGPPRFNPPLISYASGAWKLPGDDSGDRDRIVGPDSDTLRVRQRGVLIQDLTHAGDWKFTTDDTPTTGGYLSDTWKKVKNYRGAVDDAGDEDGLWITGLANNLSNLEPEETRWEKNQSLLLDNRSYGFRFHYNPSTIAMSAGVSTDVNPALIISERTTWTPITPPENPATIGVTLYLNRIEDMSFFKKTNGGYRWATNNRQGVYDGRPPSAAEIEGIMTRGTEYDLEFLFRTILGRPYPTLLRGRTADIGLIWGTPVQLWLSRAMRFKGRVTGLSWNHRSFNRFMVPMWTEVNIQFTRYPDAVSATDAQGPDVSDGYSYNKVMGFEVFDSAWAGSEGRDGTGGRR